MTSHPTHSAAQPPSRSIKPPADPAAALQAHLAQAFARIAQRRF